MVIISGTHFGGNVKTVFLIITIFFVCCTTITILSFQEVPLNLIKEEGMKWTGDEV